MNSYSRLNRVVAAALGVVLLGAVSASANTVYNANTQFDAANNPSTLGPWSYGRLDSLGVFSTLPVAATDTFGLQYWTSATGNPIPQPNVAYAPTGFALLPNNGAVVGTFVVLGPGSASPAVLRFIAPVTSAYTLDLSALGVSSNGTDAGSTLAGLAVNVGGSAVYQLDIIRQFTSVATGTLNLQAGQAVDFVATSRQNPDFDRVQISRLTLTQIPEPAALGLLVAPLALLARRR